MIECLAAKNGNNNSVVLINKMNASVDLVVGVVGSPYSSFVNVNDSALSYGVSSGMMILSLSPYEVRFLAGFAPSNPVGVPDPYELVTDPCEAAAGGLGTLFFVSGFVLMMFALGVGIAFVAGSGQNFSMDSIVAFCIGVVIFACILFGIAFMSNLGGMCYLYG